jgi:hypothetical protein
MLQRPVRVAAGTVGMNPTARSASAVPNMLSFDTLVWYTCEQKMASAKFKDFGSTQVVAARRDRDFWGPRIWRAGVRWLFEERMSRSPRRLSSITIRLPPPGGEDWGGGTQRSRACHCECLPNLIHHKLHVLVHFVFPEANHPIAAL